MADKSFKTLLPTRVPEAFEADNNLKKYLEVAGELMDEYVKAIDGFKNYKDYQYVAETRLRDLAREFAMEFPRNLDTKTQRQIIRDLKEIYSRTGVLEVINWTFRLIGWKVSMEYAWLPNPEKYDTRIKEIYNLDDYGATSRYPTQIVDFFRSDFRSFLIGEEYLTPDGVYFKGREFFDTEYTIDKLEIVGEYYKQETKTRTPDKVAKTPYVFIRISDETYNKFLSPYVDPDTGEIFSYGELEIFRVIENILHFFVFDEYRPTNIRVVIIVSTQTLDDQVGVTDFWESEYIPKPLLMDDEVVLTVDDSSRLEHTMKYGKLFMFNTPPSPFGRKMVVSPLKVTKFTNMEDPYARFITADGDSGYVISQPQQGQPKPIFNTSEFTFYTPDKEEFNFRRVYFNEDAFLSAHYETGTGDDVDDGTYPDDLDSLRLNFDMSTYTFGIVEELAQETIIIREPTSITSVHFNQSTPPANAYVVGVEVSDGVFDPNIMVDFDFVNNVYQMDTAAKTFTYSYNLSAFTKQAVQDVEWNETFTNVDNGDMENMTDYNEILMVPQGRLGFDMVFDVKYLPQPQWDNDPRGND